MVKVWGYGMVVYLMEIPNPKFPFFLRLTKFQQYTFKRIHWIPKSPNSPTKIPYIRCLYVKVHCTEEQLAQLAAAAFLHTSHPSSTRGERECYALCTKLCGWGWVSGQLAWTLVSLTPWPIKLHWVLLRQKHDGLSLLTPKKKVKVHFTLIEYEIEKPNQPIIWFNQLIQTILEINNNNGF